MESKLKKLLKYGVSYADSGQILPPVGYPYEFTDKLFLSQDWWKDKECRWWQEELDWDDLLRRDPAQVPDEDNREGYAGQNHLNYWVSGYRDYRKTLAAVEPYGICGGRYYDFGGSTGRVFRHFAFQNDSWDVWSSDFKLTSVDWNLQWFPKSIKALLNNSNPSLQMPDNYFDLVTAFSVFTHINETEISWLAELRRILKVGGVACITIHDEATWLNQVQGLRDTVVNFRPDIVDLPDLPKGKTVVTFRDDDPYNCNVFHSREHIERVWGRLFEICDIKSLYHDAQAMVICRRTD